jgi:hypothetical protein
MSLVDRLVDAVTDAESDPKIYGVVVGRVINVLDPLMLGRVQVQIPAIDALDLSPWARVATIGASLAAGVYWIPNVEDEVLVAFEQGDINAPYVIGSLWSAIMVPPLPSPVPQMRLIRSPLGNQIMFTEAPPSIIISTADMLHSITMSPAGIQIVSGANIINMTPDGVTITGTPNINLVASGAINITAPNVTVAGLAATTVGSPASPCVISGLPVKIN